MADGMSLEIQGMEELQRKNGKVVREIKDSRNLIAKAVLVIERQAKINATRRPGPKVRTNRLRSSITPEVKSSTSGRVYTDVVYAPFVEFGHRTRGGGMAPAYPFLGPTIEQTKGQLGSICTSFGKKLEDDYK